MAALGSRAPGTPTQPAENINYIREMLIELRGVAESEGCDMLCYLLEMAYIEASEVQMVHRRLSIGES